MEEQDGQLQSEQPKPITAADIPDMRESMAWDPDAQIIVKGSQFQEIARMMVLFRGAVQAFDNTIQYNKVLGTIRTTYIDGEGNPITDEQAQIYIAKANELARQVIANKEKTKAQPSSN